MRISALKIPLTAMILIGCSALEEEQKSNVNEIIKTQEIKQVKKTDILVTGENMGLSWMVTLDSIWEKSDSCNLYTRIDPTVLDSLNKVFGCQILIGFHKSDFLSTLEQQLFDAYIFNSENTQTSGHSVQFFEEQKILFTAPVKLEKATCDSLPTFGMWSLIIPTKTIVNSI